MPVDTHDDIVPAKGVSAPNVVETHEDIKPAMGLTAYHGSPHGFDKFDLAKIGTGEGAQAYGHGLYFAENEDVAKKYRDELTSMRTAPAQRILEKSGGDFDAAINSIKSEIDRLRSLNLTPETGSNKRDSLIASQEETLAELISFKNKGEMNKGHMYEVNLDVSPDHLLNWDRPLSEQPAYQAVRKHWDDKVGDPDIILNRFGLEEDSTGRDLYEALGGARRNAENASRALSEMGIRGIRYRDAGSIGKPSDKASHNIVIFDPKHIQTVRRYASGGGIKAYFMHAPHEFGERLQRAFGGAITPVEVRGGDFDDEARRLILWSYAAAPLVRPLARKDGGKVNSSDKVEMHDLPVKKDFEKIDYPFRPSKKLEKALEPGKKTGKVAIMSPKQYLKHANRLPNTKEDNLLIDAFKERMQKGEKFKALKLMGSNRADGRHRATAAEELGIKKVPVIDYRESGLNHMKGIHSVGKHGSKAGKVKDELRKERASGGPVNDAQNAVDVARNLTPMGFYSAAAEAASKIPQRAPIDQIINKVKGSPNVKAEELDWSGVRDAFAGQKSVDPAQVAQHLQANLPPIQETVYGYDSKAKRKTNMKPRYEEYSTPGGTNYREILLHLPADKDAEERDSIRNEIFRNDAKLRLLSNRVNAPPGYVQPEPEEAEAHRDEIRAIQANNEKAWNRLSELGEGKPDYQSSHWGNYGSQHSAVKNVLAHLRLTDRGMYQFGDPEALHMEEVQSDWGQEKREGEKNPDAPHVGSTEGWTDLALKRALLEAAKGKYKKLTWTPGEEQADRYGLDKSFSQIHYSPDTHHLFAKGKGDIDDIDERVYPGALHSFIGKELADKLLARPLLDNTQPSVSGEKIHSLIGGELAVPQKGMRDYYDRVIPNRLQKLVSKLDPDAKIQLYGHKIDVPGENYPSDANDWQGDEDDWDFKKVHSLEITPKLRAAILKGLPAYADGGSVGGEQQQAQVVDVPGDNVPPLPYDDTCMVHSMAHVTGKTPEEVWNVAHKYWKQGVGITPSMASHTVKELGHEWHKDRSDLVYPDLTGPATTVKKLVERLKQEPEDKKFIITTKCYGVPHAISYANGELKDIAETKPNARVSMVSEIRPKQPPKANGGSVLKRAFKVLSQYPR